MSATHKQREEFIAQLTRALPDFAPHHAADLARRLLANATTLQRLAEAQCNGDWPADNGERKVIECPHCGSCWVPSFFVKDHSASREGLPDKFVPVICKECKLNQRIEQLLTDTPLVAVVQGDPRGWVVSLYPKGTDREDINSGRARGIGVPS